MATTIPPPSYAAAAKHQDHQNVPDGGGIELPAQQQRQRQQRTTTTEKTKKHPSTTDTDTHQYICAAAEADLRQQQQPPDIHIFDPGDWSSMDAKRVIRLATGFLLLLLLPAVLLTVVLVPTYGFLIGCFWMVLILLFIALAMFLQTILHDESPYTVKRVAKAVVEAIRTEYNHFKDDCQNEGILLLLKDATYHDNINDNASAEEQIPPKMPKSKIFKFFVKPFVPLLRRRRRRRRNRNRDSRQDGTTIGADDENDNNGYVPPPHTIV